MQISKTALFGGALMAAGVAQAQQLDFAVNYGGAFPTAFTTANAIQYVSYDPGTAPVADAVDGATIGSMTNTSMFAYAYGVDQIAQSYAYVIQTADTDITITWDFSNEDPGSAPFFSDIAVVDWTNGGVTIFEVDPSGDPLTPTSGSVTLTLEAGIGYGILLEAGFTGLLGGSAVAELTVIPAPGAAALAGLAGLAAVRRRR